jgi:hypothetical protein
LLFALADDEVHRELPCLPGFLRKRWRQVPE